MKKMIALLLIVVLLFSLCSCGKKKYIVHTEYSCIVLTNVMIGTACVRGKDYKGDTVRVTGNYTLSVGRCIVCGRVAE